MDIKEINARVIKQFRAGRRDRRHEPGRAAAAHDRGARSGRSRTTPMMFHRDGDRLLVIASNIGAPRHPDWYRNLLAHPQVVVEVGHERFDAHAVPLAGTDRDRQWNVLKQTYPFIADHEAKTSREIPVVALTRTDDTAG